ncbi:MAG: NRDE family protein [Rhodospirillaceae bacterium]|nr:NRDE family protein [Rhodospirillaceae bacterium]MBL6930673.1 NRDE family protein [Rhodospirillales bacterium]
MCTLVTLRRPDHDWPLIVAANRDEKIDRPWAPPARHWPDRDNVIAGLDELAGGTWLGINDDGVIAGVLNRTGSLGPDPALRSRGELPLEALDHAEAVAVAEALFDLDPEAYRPFNLFVGDAREAFWISSLNEYGEPGMRLGDIPTGISMLTDRDLNDTFSHRVMRYLPQFHDAAAPDPAEDDWSAWTEILASKEFEDEAGPKGAMNIDGGDGFGTVCSSIIAIPSVALAPQKPRWIFAGGAPDKTPFESVEF